MTTDRSTRHFAAALESLVDHVKQDRAVLAAILCGSLSHDRVWAKSDIDLVLVTSEERKLDDAGLSLNADGVNVHALLVSRTDFRQVVEGAPGHSFMHSFLAKGRLLYTHDDTIAALFRRLEIIGERDAQLQLLRAATHALSSVYKAHKFLLTRGDLDYTALWLLYAATPLAQIEVISARQLVDREVIPQALALNPTFFKTVYVDLLNTKKTRKAVDAALGAVDGYLADRTESLFAPVLDHLRDVGEARSCRDLEHHFARNFDVHGITTACEYLADRGLIGKVSAPARLTKKSTVSVEELAFVYLTDAPDAF
jgi:polymorphic toxin system nucleotidyltransferase-like protein